jgi:hypothetical protein
MRPMRGKFAAIPSRETEDPTLTITVVTSERRGMSLLAAAITLAATLAQAQPAAQGPPTLNPTQEIAKETPEGPALVAGPTEIRIGGYLGVTGIYRSTAGGGGIGSNFATIPYSDTADGNLSEFRLSAQASRLSIRVNAAPAPDRATLAGYFEMDFNGSVPGTIAVTSNSVGFRLRNAFGEGDFHGRFFVAAGQAYTLMTPAKDHLSIWPSDYELTQAVDTNYVAGMLWGRVPQLRFTYRPSTSFNWAFSIENPEQQIGGVVTLPSCCVGDLSNQYNTGSNGLDVANAMPDIVSRAAFNRGKFLHVDAGGVLRVFRHALKPYDDTVKQAGGGIGVNARMAPATTTILLGQFAYGPGLGRYIGGLVPDVSISADGQIHPIRASSWVAGVERRLTTQASAAIYDSGVHADKSYSVDTNGADIGFGYPGAPNSANKSIHQVTGVFAWQAWRIEGRGSMQWTTQLSWLRRTPWSPGAGPSSADEIMVFSQLRYNLP